MGCLILGLVLRLAWATLFSITLKSDGLAYFHGAQTLAQDHAYEGAFWPPGFALFLTPFFMLLGAHVWVTVVSALLLFGATLWAVWSLAAELGGEVAARLATLLVATWPTYIAVTGVNCKETLLALLVTTTMITYLRATSPADRTRWGFLLLSGALIGCASLTQPSYMLFPAVIFTAEMLRNRAPWQALYRTAVFSVVVIAVILPWTYRNERTLHQRILISNNGGSVFYRANNAKANASYEAEGEQKLPKDTTLANAEGYRLADDWIAHHPIDFGILAVRKQVVFLGDDGIGPYESMKRDLHPSGLLYNTAKMICNLFWGVLWFFLFLAAPGQFRTTGWPLWYSLCFLPFVYQWLIDSVFESGSRHHLPYVGLIAVMLAVFLTSKAPETEYVETT